MMGRDGVVASPKAGGSKPCMSRIEAAISSADGSTHSHQISEDLHSSRVLNAGISSNLSHPSSKPPLHIGTADHEGHSQLSSTVSQMMRMREAEAEVTAHMQDELQAIRGDIRTLSSKLRSDVRAELERLQAHSPQPFGHFSVAAAAAVPGAAIVEPPPMIIQQISEGTEPPLLFNDADGYPPRGNGGSNRTNAMPLHTADVSTPDSFVICGWGDAKADATEMPLAPVVPSFGSEKGVATRAAANAIAAKKRAAAATMFDDTAVEKTILLSEPGDCQDQQYELESGRNSFTSAATFATMQTTAAVGLKSRKVQKAIDHTARRTKSMFVVAEEMTAPETTYRDKLLIMANSAAFDYVSAVLVLCNAFTIGLQTDYMAKEVTEHVPMPFRVIDLFFCVAFTSELSFRICAFQGDFFYGDDYKWNVFDFALVLMQLIDEILSSIAMGPGFNFSFWRILRILRLIRIVRIIRILRLISELRTIVSSIMGSLKSLMWTVALLFLLVYVFGVFFTQLVLTERIAGLGDTDSDIALETHFSSLGRSILSLYQAISGGVDWDDLATPLMLKISVVLGFIFAFYIAFALLALFNVVTGVFVEAALKSAKEDRDSYMLHHVKNLFVKADSDQSGTLDWCEFESSLKEEAMQEFFKSIDVDISEAKAVFLLLDVDDSGRIDLEEFLNGCLGLRGPAQAIHLATLMHETRMLARGYHTHTQKIDKHTAFVEKSLTKMTQAMSSINESTHDIGTSMTTMAMSVDTGLDRRLGTLLHGASPLLSAHPSTLPMARPLLGHRAAAFDAPEVSTIHELGEHSEAQHISVASTRNLDSGRNAVHVPRASALPGCVYGAD